MRPGRKNGYVSTGVAARCQFETQVIEKAGERVGNIADQSKVAKRLLLSIGPLHY
jgi:hypothetical protein